MSLKSALKEVTNAVLDLQAADFNTYHRPLKRLWAALEAPELAPTTNRLRERVDFDAFVDRANKGGSFAGSTSLNWPTEREEELGLAAEFIKRAAENTDWFLGFAHRYYYSGNKIVGDIRKVTTSVIVPFERDFRQFMEDQEISKPEINRPAKKIERNSRVFIVHGHDEGARETVARFIETVGLEPVILHEQANRGMTVPEKLAAYSEVGFAIVLLTPDDLGKAKNEKRYQKRARQNVLLELGYFIGMLGRENVCALKRGEVDIPSDYLGVVYTPFDEAGAWRVSVANELEAAGYGIDWNRVMSKRTRA